MILYCPFYQGYSRWSLSENYCPIDGTSDFRWSILINFVQDLTLLCVMFSGVLHKKNSTRLWNMLYIQGLWWILAWILTEVPSIVRHSLSRPPRSHGETLLRH